MNHKQSVVEYVVTDGTKLAPPVAVSGGMVLGMELQDWVLIATLVYTVLQIVLTVHKFLKDRKNGSKRD